MFDSIASTYDRLNHLLSLGIDHSWRKKVRACLPEKKGIRLLDMATGTGDLLIPLSYSNKIKEAVGADLSKKMLEICEKKINKTGLRKNKKIELRVEDLENLSFKPHSFDVVTIAFGIRNVDNPLKALKETYKVLSPTGELLILELSIPENVLVRCFYLFYFRYLLPLIGGIISKNFTAYRYLNRTVEDFPQGTNFCEILIQAGFSGARYETMSLGIVTLYLAKKW